MITVEEALDIVLAHAGDYGTERIVLENSIGRVLREDVYADRDFPPYDRVTMDGIAIIYDDFAAGQRQFEVAGIAPAGAEQLQLNSPGTCVEVMTGAIMPAHYDTVIRYEDVEIKDGVATIAIEMLQEKQNIHFKGEDRASGDKIISEGIQITSTEVGVCATVGLDHVEVSKLPRTVIISTGDELVKIDETPLPHQIRRSNVYRIQTAMKNFHVNVETRHLNDDYDEIVSALRKLISEFDLIILSGGVSKGKFDYLPAALDEIGVTKHFHRIRQRPGKPFWFGTKETATVFAFPGNPVSSFMCMQQYFVPWLEKSIGISSRDRAYGVLTTDVTFTPDLTYFLEVRITFDSSGKVLATPVKGNGSGDLANLVDADAFIQLARGRNEFTAGEVFPLIPYRKTAL